MNKVSPSRNLTRSIPKHEKAAVTAESNGLKCLGGEPGLLTRRKRKNARTRRPNSFGSLVLQMWLLPDLSVGPYSKHRRSV